MTTPLVQSFETWAWKRGLVGPLDDHSAFSGHAHLSKRAKADWEKRMAQEWREYEAGRDEYQALVNAGEIVDPTGHVVFKAPRDLEKEAREAKARNLRRSAQNLLDLAERGMRTRAYRKAAEKMLAEAAALLEES